MASDEKLKACPFCGSEAEYDCTDEGDCNLQLNYWVGCKGASCEALIDWCDSKEEAYAAWNRRAPAPGAVRAYVRRVKGRKLEHRHLLTLSASRECLEDEIVSSIEEIIPVEVRPVEEGE